MGALIFVPELLLLAEGAAAVTEGAIIAAEGAAVIGAAVEGAAVVGAVAEGTALAVTAAEAATVAVTAAEGTATIAEGTFGAWYATTFGAELAELAVAVEASATVAVEASVGVGAETAIGVGSETVMEVIGASILDDIAVLDSAIILPGAPAEVPSLTSIIGGLVPTKEQIGIGIVTYAGSRIADDIITEMTKPDPNQGEVADHDSHGNPGNKAAFLTFLKDLGIETINVKTGASGVFTAIDKIIGAPDSNDATTKSLPSDCVVAAVRHSEDKLRDIDAFEQGRRLGSITADLVGHLGINDITETTLASAAYETATDNNREATLKIYQYIRASNEFRDRELYRNDLINIGDVYNGNVSEPFYVDSVLYITDETGRNIPNYGNDTGIVLSPLYGIFGGPYSPNNQAPIDKLDSLFFLHDQAYVELGMFSHEADMQLVSRLAHQFPNFNLKQKLMARFAMGYFTTGGVIMSSLLGSTSGGSYYNTTSPPLRSRTLVKGFGISSDDNRKELFETGLKLGYAERLEMLMNTYGVPTANDSNKGIVEAFDNILVSVA